MYFKDAIPFNEPYETSGHLEAATISFIDILVHDWSCSGSLTTFDNMSLINYTLSLGYNKLWLLITEGKGSIAIIQV